METSGTVAIVTAGGSGLGAYLAEGLAQAGARVLVADLDPDMAAATAERINGRAVPCDVSDAGDLRRLAKIAEDEGGPHILVNNAGGWSSGGKQYPDADFETWSRALDLNLRAPMLLTQLCLGAMSRNGGGAVVNISSVAGLENKAYGSPEYGAAKAALIRLTTSLGDLHRTHKVRVSCIVPDWIGLDRAYRELEALPPGKRERTPPLIPPEAIVAVALDLIRGEASGTVVEMWGGEEPRVKAF
jgi:NAD(P)-dependent dehydrogenase (short-subunit alcohol dehydrogenase family)